MRFILILIFLQLTVSVLCQTLEVTEARKAFYSNGERLRKGDMVNLKNVDFVRIKRGSLTLRDSTGYQFSTFQEKLNITEEYKYNLLVDSIHVQYSKSLDTLLRCKYYDAFDYSIKGMFLENQDIDTAYDRTYLIRWIDQLNNPPYFILIHDIFDRIRGIFQTENSEYQFGDYEYQLDTEIFLRREKGIDILVYQVISQDCRSTSKNGLHLLSTKNR